MMQQSQPPNRSQARISNMSYLKPGMKDSDASSQGLLWLTDPCQNSPSNGKLDGAGDTYGPTSQRTSLRLPGSISHDLLAKISRFETLDGLSVPITTSLPQLQPPPLRRKSSFVRTDTDSMKIRKLSTVSSLRSGQNGCEGKTKDQNEILETLDARHLRSTLEEIKSRIGQTTIEVCYKPTSIRLRKGQRSQKVSSDLQMAQQPSSSKTQTPSRGQYARDITTMRHEGKASHFSFMHMTQQTASRAPIPSIFEKEMMGIIPSQNTPHFAHEYGGEEYVPNFSYSKLGSNTGNASRNIHPSPKSHNSLWSPNTADPSHLDVESVATSTKTIEKSRAISQDRFPSARGDDLERLQSPTRGRPQTFRKSSFESVVEIPEVIVAKSQTKDGEHRIGIPHKPPPPAANSYDIIRSVSDNIPTDPIHSSVSEAPGSKHIGLDRKRVVQRSYSTSLRPLSPHARSLGTLRSLVTRCTGSHDKKLQGGIGNVPGKDYSSRGKISAYYKASGGKEMGTKTANSLKDKIEFFDGAMSRATNTARPSIASGNAASPITPNDQGWSTNSLCSKAPSTGTARRISDSHHTQSIMTKALQGIFQSPANYNRDPIFRLPTKNPFKSPASGGKSFTSGEISPTSRLPTISPTQRPVFVRDLHLSPQQIGLDPRSNKNQTREVDYESVRKISWLGNASQGSCVRSKEENFATLRKRQVGEKIDQLLLLENLKRKQEALIEESKLAAASLSSKKAASPSTSCAAVTKVRRSCEVQRSKVSNMRRIFDGGSKAGSSLTAPYVKKRSAGDSKAHDGIMNQVADGSPKEILRPPPPPVPRLPPRHFITTAKSSTPLSKAINQRPGTKKTAELQIKESESHFAFSPIDSSKSRVRSRAVEEKIRMFEEHCEDDLPKAHIIGRVLGRKINRSLKGLFEPYISRSSQAAVDSGRFKHATWGKKEQMSRSKAQRRGLTVEEVEEVMDEFKDFMPATRIRQAGKASKSRGLLNEAPNLGQDGTHSGSPSLLGENEMIVKEVDCGLRHPRPLRLLEISRMVALCRDKVGMSSIRYKDKESGLIL